MSLRKENPQLYYHIHYWANLNVPKPDKCIRCDEYKLMELSNNSGKYALDILDWEWICKSCHAKKDRWGDLEKAHQALRGKPSWNRGISHSDETKRKLSESHRGKTHSGSFKPGNKPWITGRKMSEEHKRKIGIANSRKKD